MNGHHSSHCGALCPRLCAGPCHYRQGSPDKRQNLRLPVVADNCRRRRVLRDILPRQRWAQMTPSSPIPGSQNAVTPAVLRDLWASGFVRARDVAVAGCRVRYMVRNPVRLVPNSIPLPAVNSLPQQVTAGAARNSSKLRHPLFPIIVRGDTPNGTGFVNLFGLVKATRSLFGALLQYPQKSLGSLCVSLRRFVLSWFVPAHVEQQTTKADEACSKNQAMRFTA